VLDEHFWPTAIWQVGLRIRFGCIEPGVARLSC